MGYAILRDEAAFREKIKELFNARTRARRRVVMGPFPELKPWESLPDARNVELYAWGADQLPDQKQVNILKKLGVKLYWVEPLDLKLFWVKRTGAIIVPGPGDDQVKAPNTVTDLESRALYWDAGAVAVLEAVWGPLFRNPAGDEAGVDFHQCCGLLNRLARGFLRAESLKSGAAPGASWGPGIHRTPSPLRAPGLTSPRWGQVNLEQTAWHAFLEEESREPEGLLGFYDRPRSTRLERLCRFYAAWLGLLGEDPKRWDTFPALGPGVAKSHCLLD